MSLIRNERTKLTAAFLNGIAIAIFAVGGLTQTIKAATETAGPAVAGTATAAICFATSFALHLLARWILGRLEP